jgi:hypothetical protein
MILAKDQHKSLAELGFFALFLLALNDAGKTNQKKRHSPGEEHSVHRLSRPLIIVRSRGEIKQNKKGGKRGLALFFSVTVPFPS